MQVAPIFIFCAWLILTCPVLGAEDTAYPLTGMNVPFRPPLPAPPPVQCLPPRGTGLPKPALSWKAGQKHKYPNISSNKSPANNAADNPAYSLGAARAYASLGLSQPPSCKDRIGELPYGARVLVPAGESPLHTPGAQAVPSSFICACSYLEAFQDSLIACRRAGLLVLDMDSSCGQVLAQNNTGTVRLILQPAAAGKTKITTYPSGVKPDVLAQLAAGISRQLSQKGPSK